MVEFHLIQEIIAYSSNIILDTILESISYIPPVIIKGYFLNQ
jgi:hypothetical protein